MTEHETVLAICRELALPAGQWVIAGSGAMIMQGITAVDRGKPMGDLDVFVATRTWFKMLEDPRWCLFTTDPDDPKRRSDPPYLTRKMHGLRVDVFFGWRVRHVGDMDVAFWILNAVDVEGVPCARLQFVLDIKRELGRAKDVWDIRVLEERLGEAVL